jgi:taurine dioxygenase
VLIVGDPGHSLAKNGVDARIGGAPGAVLEILPIEPALPYGARIRGVTLDLLRRPDIRAELNACFEVSGILLFEDVEQSDEMQLALSTTFGPLKEHPVAAIRKVDNDRLPGVIEIRSRANAGGIVALDGKLRTHWLPWHFDHCYNDELNRAGVMRSVERVEEGGLTGFVDGIVLYDLFPEELRARIEGRNVIYWLDGQYDTMRFGRPADLKVIRAKPMPPGFEEQAKATPRAIHPAVWTRRDGAKVLHVSPYMAQGIQGDETPKGDDLLEAVCQTINRLAECCSYHHEWQGTEMVIWDNWRLLHSVSGNRPQDERLMYRTTIKGDYGLGCFETAT